MVIIANNKFGDYMKKKYLLILIIIVGIIILIPKESEEFRIRVVANSDSPLDQIKKMEVVDALKKRICQYNKDNIVNEIINNIDVLDNDIGNVLLHKDYSISVTKVRFPAKEHNGQIISGGKYRTLLVVIGEGKGKNWWSLLYPDYHGISFEDDGNDTVQYKFYFWEELKKLLFNG